MLQSRRCVPLLVAGRVGRGGRGGAGHLVPREGPDRGDAAELLHRHPPSDGRVGAQQGGGAAHLHLPRASRRSLLGKEAPPNSE
eukprot:283348-Prorocentrum_minimum.AAC.1